MKSNEDEDEFEESYTSNDHKRSVVYVQQDRRVPKFSGYNMAVEDWIEDVNSCTREMSKQERADFIYSYLDGSAKEEVKYRSNSVRHNPTRILQVLQDAFGVKDSVSKLQKNFLDRIQGQSESLREYSYALMELMRKINRKDQYVISNGDKALCDQFSQNVKDVMLRKHLKRLVRSQPDISFLDLREEAIMWSEEEESCDALSFGKSRDVKSEIKVNSTESDRMNELLDIVKKQSDQINALTKIVNSKDSTQSGSNGNSYRQPLCFNCKKPGHKIADCPNKQGNYRHLP